MSRTHVRTAPSPVPSPSPDTVPTPTGPTGGGTTPSVRVGLQGIHDVERNVVAYELLFRAPGDSVARLHSADEHDRATAQVITTTFGEFGAHELADGRLLFLNTTRAFFTGELPLPFPPAGVVLELLETITVDDDVLTGLRTLRERGYVIAVDDFDGEPSRVPALSWAQYVKIDLEVTGDRLGEVIDLVRTSNPSALVVVERIETEAQFATCLALGVDLFQGFLLQRPVVKQRQTLTPSHLTCVQLLAGLHDEDTPLEDLLDLLTQDAALSMRILKTVSSAAHAPKTGVTSLQQAVVLLGRKELVGWVTLVLLGGSTSGTALTNADVTHIFTRAWACRLMVPQAPDTAFIAGLLSGAAEALGVEPAELLRGCVVAPVIRDAFLDGSGDVGSALQAIENHESLFRESSTGREGAPRPGTPDVSTAYLGALRQARATVTRLFTR